MEFIDRPFKRVAVDLVGTIALASDNGKLYILTVIDYETRYIEAVALSRIDTITVAEALLEIVGWDCLRKSLVILAHN